VVKLRQAAFDESRKKLKKHFHGRVKLELTVYASNILQRKDTDDYVGDLDALIGGVFESLQPAPNNPDLKLHQSFKNNNDIDGKNPVIVADDAQIVSVIANKIQSEQPSYHVIIEPE